MQAEFVREGERVGAGDLGEVRHDDDVGDDDAPAAHPAGHGAEGAGHPGEGGAAVGFGLVELAVGHRDEVHGQEGQQHDGGRLEASAARDDEAECRGE